METLNLSNIYSDNFQKLIRIISLIATLILLSSNIFRLINFDENLYAIHSNYDIITFCLNSICIALSILLLFRPSKIGFITIMAFLLSISCFFDCNNPMAILMYFLGTSTLFARGCLKKNKSIKIILLII